MLVSRSTSQEQIGAINAGDPPGDFALIVPEGSKTTLGRSIVPPLRRRVPVKLEIVVILRFGIGCSRHRHRHRMSYLLRSQEHLIC